MLASKNLIYILNYGGRPTASGAARVLATQSSQPGRKVLLCDTTGQSEKESENNETIKSEIGWGHQIRSYVLQPYQLVKDLRNKTENSNPSSVLDGNIDQFIEEGIKNK